MYYNRFRYYDSNSGLYIPKDPIELAGNNPTMYAYVWDSNGQVDVFGLDLYDIISYNQKATGFEKHHGVMDAWASKNIPEYKGRYAPTVVLTPAQHNATRFEFMKWKKEKFGTTMAKVDWEKISTKEMQALSERMFDRAGVPMDVRNNYYNALNEYNYKEKITYK